MSKISRRDQTTYTDRRYRLLDPDDAPNSFILPGFEFSFERVLDVGFTGDKKYYFQPGKGPEGTMKVWRIILPGASLGGQLPPAPTIFSSLNLFAPKTLRRAILHVSINTMGEAFTYDMARTLRYLFFPGDVDVLQVLPTVANYVNVHDSVYHLWQSPFDWEVHGV
jgi:hypothetical protein